jgi:pyruvate dehydrogenase E2 component (dihydrolipoamide acetyltransferase)
VEPEAIVPVGETIAFIASAGESVPMLAPLYAGVSETAEKTAFAVADPVPAQKERGPVRASPAVRHIAKQLGIDLNCVTGTGPEGRITEQDVHTYAGAYKSPRTEIAPGVSISPVARRMAQEHGVDLERIQGTGPQGRITKEDIEALSQAEAGARPSAPPVEPARGEVDWLDLNPIQRLTGQRMLESIRSAPHFGLAVDVDMTGALKFREDWMDQVVKETGERLSVTGILIKAAACALKRFPRANASFDAGRIKLHKQINIGVAVGTEQGLVVPVIQYADRKSLIQITQDLKIFRDKAANMRFATDDLAGGTFTVTNLGMYGVDRFDAIINPPESAILAAGRIVKRPIGMPDDTIALRPMVTLTLSVDHRSLDGVQGANFLGHIRELVEDPNLLFE